MGLSVLTGSAFAQTSAGRISKAIEGYETAQVSGTANPHALSQFDAGRVSSEKRLEGVTMYFAPTTSQQEDLNTLIREQQTKGSANYHKWLTPAQFAARFGMSNADIAKVKTWLENQGFTVDRVANSRTSISFSGSVSQVETAFNTELHNYTRNGVTHFANSTPVSVPAQLSGLVRTIRNLDDFRPQPHMRLHKGSASPNFTSSQGNGNHFMTPGDVSTIYNVKDVYSAGYDGSGQSIAIIGQSAVDVTDIENFQTAASLTVKDPTLVLVPSSGTSTVYTGDESESDLDLEYSGAIAKGATIYFVYVGSSQNYSVWDSLQYAIDTDIAPVVSLSYGECEADLGSSDLATLEAILAESETQGQSVIVSSGDTGSTACYAEVSTTATSVTAAETALAVAYPASSAYVTALGGTEFPATSVSSSNTTYWESASGSDVVSSALTYIPEQVWNDDSATYGSEYGAYYAVAGGGGGTSVDVTRPTWQTGVTGIPSGKYRLVPDISLDSSSDNAPYLYCTSDTTAWYSTQKASCNSGFRDSSTQYLTAAGGTSFAAPIFAGMLAIINQATKSTGQGVAASELYSLASDSTTYASAFHDILPTGTNFTSSGNQCTAGSTYCSTAGAASYLATTGYDEASGLGSIDLYELMLAWPGYSTGTASTLDATVTSLSPASSNPASGVADVISITVAPSSTSVTTTPTGTLSVSVDGTVVSSSLALTSGSASYSFSSATAGEHVITATYSGDDTFAASTGTTTVDVGASTTTSTGSGTFTLAATNVSVTQGRSGTSTITLTSADSYAGTVDFSVTTDDNSLGTYGCYYINAADALAVTANAKATATMTIYTSESSCSATSSVRSGLRHSFKKRTTVKTAQLSSPATPWQSAMRMGAAFSLAGVCLIGLGRRRRKLWSLMALLVVTGILGFASGCGSGSKTTTDTSTDVAVGTYTLTLDGADSTTSSIANSTTLTLTVTK